ncbi:MAG: glycoside hydrolase family 3 C-terminal domain-containing protein, partial [Actinobacteria bacterium]|nr:glycoside hydrolase family 3 C-terminal domain-containing protein [Actinomycetota bacterium]
FGFDGVVVADYYGISFLELLHQVAGSPAEAAALALAAGVDVELPNVRCYGEPLAAAVRDGRVPERLIDRAAGRVLRQKCELGLLDPGNGSGWAPGRPAAPEQDGGPDAGGPGAGGPGAASLDGAAGIDLDPPGHRALARRLAEESVVLLANPAGALPLAAEAGIAVVGPLADDPLAFFGGYAFPRHVGPRYPETGIGVPVATLLAALRAELPRARIGHAPGCEVRSGDRSGFGAAVDCARAADVVLAVLGDDAGLFGGGSSGEGSDAADLSLPGVQGELLAELIATGRPVVLVQVSGRPYALGPFAGGLAAALLAFFGGEEGGNAIAAVLSGRVTPSGRLPVEVPASPAAQATGYLRAPLADRTGVSTVDPTPLYPFGHGLSYTTFRYQDLAIRPAGGEGPADAEGPADGEVPAVGAGPADGARPVDGEGPVRIATDGAADISCTLRNTGDRPGAEVVQLYLRDPVAQVVRPVRYLAGFARVELAPGEALRVTFRVHADRTAFCGRDGNRVVEPGLIEAEIGASAADIRLRGSLTLAGPERAVGSDRVLTTPVSVTGA